LFFGPESRFPWQLGWSCQFVSFFFWNLFLSNPNLQVPFFPGNFFLPGELARRFRYISGCISTVGVKANCGRAAFERCMLGGGRVPEADAALNCSVPGRCIKYASDWSYAATVADDLHSFILTKI
jgi:hypothetical protein